MLYTFWNNIYKVCSWNTYAPGSAQDQSQSHDSRSHTEVILPEKFHTKFEVSNTWLTNIKKWTELKGGECARMAADRNLWSVISRQPSSRRWHLQVIQVISLTSVTKVT